MSLYTGEPFDLQRIQKEFNIPQRKIKGCGLSELDLKEIYEDFQKSIPYLEDIRTKILSDLNSELTDKIHSVRGRIKKPDHLIEKIIRNKCEKPKKYDIMNIGNYNKIVTDLIGFRIIILDKKDWRDVHDKLLEIFQNIPERYAVEPSDLIKNFEKYPINKKENAIKSSYHAEKPVAYLTEVDDLKLFEAPYLGIDHSKTHYRSIHYIIRYENLYFEIQVRTLFEEGWLEFDHRIKYPYDQNNKKKQEFLTILNSIATAADRLISFYDERYFHEELPDNIQNDTDVSTDKILEKDNFKDKLLLRFNGR